MTIAALRSLLTEIDQQGGPQAARHNRLQLPDERTPRMTHIATHFMTDASPAEIERAISEAEATRDRYDRKASVLRGLLATRHDQIAAGTWETKTEQPTEAVIDANGIELDGGDVMLQEMSVGDPIEIETQTGPLSPGIWKITEFVDGGHSRARVRRMTGEEIEAARRGEAFARIYE